MQNNLCYKEYASKVSDKCTLIYHFYIKIESYTTHFVRRMLYGRRDVYLSDEMCCV